MNPDTAIATNRTRRRTLNAMALTKGIRGYALIIAEFPLGSDPVGFGDRYRMTYTCTWKLGQDFGLILFWARSPV